MRWEVYDCRSRSEIACKARASIFFDFPWKPTFVGIRNFVLQERLLASDSRQAVGGLLASLLHYICTYALYSMKRIALSQRQSREFNDNIAVFSLKVAVRVMKLTFDTRSRLADKLPETKSREDGKCITTQTIRKSLIHSAIFSLCFSFWWTAFDSKSNLNYAWE